MLYVFERQCPACGTVNVRLTAGANAVWTCLGCKRDLTQPTAACRVRDVTLRALKEVRRWTG